MEDDKKQYSKISKEMRQEIIDRICTQKQPILDVAQDYQLLPSTCKSIVNTYMKEGRVGKKESRIRKLKKVVNTYNIVLNPIQPLLSTVQIAKNVQDCVEKSRKSMQESDEQPEESAPKQTNLDEQIQQWMQQFMAQFNMLNQMYTQQKMCKK